MPARALTPGTPAYRRARAPKRTEERAGHRSKAELARKVQRDQPTARPEPDEDWHPKAIALYDSLGESGQSEYYEPSDWAFAQLMCQMASDLLYQSARRGSGSSELLKAILTGMDRLGVTEGSRRIMRVEVERPDPNAGKVQDEKVAVMSRYRKAAKSGG